MESTETELKVDNNLIEDILVISPASENGQAMLIPDNKAEVIIPLTCGGKMKPIGHSREISLCSNKGYFLMPRSRGLLIKHPNDGFRCVVLKINPIYSKKIGQNLREISNSLFEFNLSSDLLESLKIANSIQRKNEFENLIVDLLGISTEKEENLVSSTILDSIDRIKYAGGSITIKEIYSSLSVSKSKLEQHFNREIGLTPKEFCKIEKINYFIKSYNKKEGKSLTELTYECGYYDQSHLIKDFRYFMDISPKQYFDSVHI